MSKFKPSYSDFALIYDEFMDGVPYHDWASHVERLFHAHQREPQTILDCACGTGNLSWELASRGYEVVGVDRSKGMIERALEKNASSSPHLKPPTFLIEDLCDFSLPERFDAATCLFDSLNYIIEKAALEKALFHIGKHVKSGGIFVFDLNTPLSFESDLFTQTSEITKHQIYYDWNATFDRKARICSVKMSLFKFQDSGEELRIYEDHLERAYEIEEIRQILEQTGWELTGVYHEYTLDPGHERSKRWFFTAIKQSTETPSKNWRTTSCDPPV